MRRNRCIRCRPTAERTALPHSCGNPRGTKKKKAKLKKKGSVPEELFHSSRESPHATLLRLRRDPHVPKVQGTTFFSPVYLSSSSVCFHRRRRLQVDCSYPHLSKDHTRMRARAQTNAAHTLEKSERSHEQQRNKRKKGTTREDELLSQKAFYCDTRRHSRRV